MRYLIAILFAIVGAAIAFVFLSGPVANWASLQMKFDSSDDAEMVNQMAFMAVNFLGLLVGWTLGWALGAGFGGKDGAPRPG